MMARATATSARAKSTTRPGGARRPRSKPLVGITTPRLFSPPLRRLTRKTTRGYEVIDFARDILGEPLLPWQEFAVIHGLELLPNGTYRFRTVIALVARQNGKTHLSKVLSLWRLYVDGAQLVLGVAQDLDIAREVLEACNETIDTVPELAAEKVSYITANGKESLNLTGRRKYKIKPPNRRAGRGLSVDQLNLDEIREHRDWLAWSALSKTTTARATAQTWALSNAGDEGSVVLNHLRGAAGVSQNGDGVSIMGEARDASIGIFEWSAEEGCELDDTRAWRQANPALGITVSEAAIRSALGTDPPEIFRTEVLCQKVDALNSALDIGAWNAGADPAGSMKNLRSRVIACVDVAPDGQHVALLAAAQTPDGRYRVEPVDAWSNTDDARMVLFDLSPAGLLKRMNPAAVAWFSGGPAKVLGADMRALAESGTTVAEIKDSEASEACMSFADLVDARRIIHPADPLLDAHAAGAQKYPVGDGWRFVRRGAGHVSAIYAAAGAVHTLRTSPVEKPLPKPMVV